MAGLLARLGDPQRRVRALHVAGTKGKGSTCAFAESLCRAAGLRTGMTTSPHLSSARERIVLGGEMISAEAFVALASEVEVAAAGLDASFFEKMVAMAFIAFAEARVDVAVVEVGLGGRLDATNLCVPRACAITRLGLDHTEHLGPTLRHIAREKAGILKAGVPAVTAPQDPDALDEVVGRAAAVAAPLEVIAPNPALLPSLAGAHQVENASLAVALVGAAGIPLGPPEVERGLAAARWPGRYERLRDSPALVVDGAHNDTAARALVETALADAAVADAPAVILGMTRGHDPEAFARALAPLRPRRVIAVASRSPRSLPADAVARGAARALGLAEEATLPVALAAVAATPAIVTGSLYLVGEVRALLVGGPSDPAFPLF